MEHSKICKHGGGESLPGECNVNSTFRRSKDDAVQVMSLWMMLLYISVEAQWKEKEWPCRVITIIVRVDPNRSNDDAGNRERGTSAAPHEGGRMCTAAGTASGCFGLEVKYVFLCPRRRSVARRGVQHTSTVDSLISVTLRRECWCWPRTLALQLTVVRLETFFVW